MFSLYRLSLSFLLTILFASAFAQCNGHLELCDKRFNEVSYLTTHNAFNAEEDGFTLPNHTYGLTRQMEDGVRGLMLDVYDEGGVATVYHGFAFLGTATLESNLLEVKTFLDNNPNDIITIIFECYADFPLMKTAFENSGLINYVHEQDLGAAWPTLQEMIDADKRLVVLSERTDAPANENWYHYVWDYAVETPFENNSNADFTCEFNRGNEQNDLFILNHFATDPSLGTGRTDLSALANDFDFFYNRARECQASLGKFPNFPTIDFHEYGEPFRVVDSLNLALVATGIDENASIQSIKVYPSIGAGDFSFKSSSDLIEEIRVFNNSGNLVYSEQMNKASLNLDLKHLPAGVYLTSILTKESISAFKLIITK